MKNLNAAQRILIALGADPIRISLGGFRRGRVASNTRKGPGRIHRDGKPEAEAESEEAVEAAAA